jgi:phosphoglycolate phosphatase
VCTNKLAWLSVRLLDRLGLAERFVAICGRDTFGIEKPDPEILRRTILAAGGDLADSIMVGDSGTDIATARAAGVPVVAVDFGYTEVPVAALSDHIISHWRPARGGHALMPARRDLRPSYQACRLPSPCHGNALNRKWLIFAP